MGVQEFALGAGGNCGFNSYCVPARREKTSGQVSYCVLRVLNVACLTEILQVKCVGGFISFFVGDCGFFYFRIIE